jgi:hypothetical protein
MTIKPSRALVGTWQSDRAKTLEYWSFSKTTSAKAKRMYRANDFFGHLYWRATRDSLETWTRILPGIFRQRYRVIWENQHSVTIVFLGDNDKEIRQVVFPEPDRFYMLAGKANCEWFKRVKSSKALARAARDRSRALKRASPLPRRPRSSARTKG